MNDHIIAINPIRTMLRNYLKIAYRSLMRHKGFSFINISGLAIGMAACLFILQYASFELSYDDFHENGADIYRVASIEGTTHGRPMVPPPLGPGLQADFPQVVNFTRLILPWSGQAATSTLAWEGTDGSPALQTFQWGFYGDQGFLEMFSFPWIKGDRQQALAGPNKIVLSETAARKLFGNQWSEDQVIGKELEYTNEYDRFQLVVTGIIGDAPANSHFQYDFLASFSTLSTGWGKGYAGEWHGNSTYTLHTVIEKTKEIGIRKVLGASVLQIVTLLTTGNLKLVALACIAALPLSWWGTESWLSRYAFRIEQEWWLFAIPVFAVSVIVLLAVGFHTLRAALANPAEAIRNE